MLAGTPIAMKFENGVEVSMTGTQTVSEELSDDVHLFLTFKEDLLAE